jgi:uncharacterized protein
VASALPGNMNLVRKQTNIFGENSLAGNIVLFSRVLKDRGLVISVPTVMDALAGVAHVGVDNRDDFKTVLKATFVSREEESHLFDRLFHDFWIDRPLEMELSPTKDEPESEDTQDQDETESQETLSLSDSEESDSERREGLEKKQYTIYSPTEVLRQQDFRDIPEGYDHRMAKLMREITAPLVKRISSKRRAVYSGASLDMRLIFRRNIKYGGQIYELPGMKPKLRIKKLVFLCDVSGSMYEYQKFMLRFVKELQQLPTKIETFVFATELHRVTPFFKKMPFSKAMDQIGRDVRDWSGGTRIGQSLQKFSRVWGDSMLGSSTVVIIHSDGWDRGEPSLLDQEMARMHRRVYRILWINPLLGGPSYEPTCRGMRTALPHIDYFLPGHNLLSLERISGTLRGFL